MQLLKYVLPFVFATTTSIAPITIESPTIPKAPPTATEMVQEVFGEDAPVMLAIAKCESNLTQYNAKGEALRGRVDSNDRGIFQISRTYWLDKSLELGLDIETLEGNIAMAKVIKDTQGLSAWVCYDIIKAQ